jgi:peptide/nickel transport system permease protein
MTEMMVRRLPADFGSSATPEARAEAERLTGDWLAVDDGAKPQSFWVETFKRFLENKVGVGAACFIVLLALAAIIAPWVAPHDPLVGVATDRLMSPFESSSHILGTDEQGRDLLSRLIYGGRLTLIAAFVPTIAATVIGTVIGVTAAMMGGLVQTVLMRSMDMLYAFPAVLLAIAVGASLGPGLANALIAVTIVSVPPVSRVAESATRRVVTKEFVDAAKLSGASPVKVATSQIVPNVLNDIIVYASGLVGVAMLIAASLSFLGLGSLPPAPEWGFMLNSMRNSISIAMFNVMLPGLMIFLTSVCFNLASDALREATDSRL